MPSRSLRQTLCGLCVKIGRIQDDRIAGESREAGGGGSRRSLPPIGVDLSQQPQTRFSLFHAGAAHLHSPRMDKLQLLHDNRSLLVMARLPNAHDRAVRLDLVNIAALNPNILHLRDRRDDGRLDDDGSRDDRRRRHHGRRCDDDRSRRRRGDDDRCRTRGDHRAADESTDETRPEVPPAASPEAVVRTGRRRVRTGRLCGGTSRLRTTAGGGRRSAGTRQREGRAEKCGNRENDCSIHVRHPFNEVQCGHFTTERGYSSTAFHRVKKEKTRSPANDGASKLVLGAGLEPARISPHAPQACVSANFTTRADVF